jgi:hypothetical protein
MDKHYVVTRHTTRLDTLQALRQHAVQLTVLREGLLAVVLVLQLLELGATLT